MNPLITINNMEFVENAEKITNKRTNKEEFDQLWQNLADELNVIGPPYYDVSGWQKKWSEHNYNKKRKRPLDVETPNTPSRQGNLNFVY